VYSLWAMAYFISGEIKEGEIQMNAEERMIDWCVEHEHDDAVWGWLSENPPPPLWNGSAIEYAYEEMPFGLLTGRPGCII